MVQSRQKGEELANNFFTMKVEPDWKVRFREFAESRGGMTAIAKRGIEMIMSGAAAPLSTSRSFPEIGKAICGPFAQVVEDSTSSFLVSEDTIRELGMQDGDLFVRSYGDSMEASGIAEGALVAVRPLAEHRRPRNNEIALVQIVMPNGDCLSTIKHWKQINNDITLSDGAGETHPIPAEAVQIVPVAVVKGVIAAL